jgi:hypothetical protein
MTRGNLVELYPQRTGTLGLTSGQACYADALVKGALGFLPGYNATKTLASFCRIQFQPGPVRKRRCGATTGFNSGATPFAAGSPTGPQIAARDCVGWCHWCRLELWQARLRTSAPSLA